MSESTPLDKEAGGKALLSALISLTDDFHKFTEECAFLCDAFAAVAREPECINEDTSEGIGHISYWLKDQVKGYDERINVLYKTLHNRHIQAAENEEQE
ncbi:hypothetical protein SG34_023385 [Thalassomonas viridans]|uniref:Uncharacterized protein n=1 Tax=Thalassomonas viridans TaxID=137584 RepID=A0AAE9Z1E4_9GAMM|nr:hypothetical protein [Thalassomonas viridans]WDE04254.1 hypothetical protein SG34_023385 [Thalassomonas viridans]